MKLHDFQKEGVSFLTSTRAPILFLFDDMGLGKTVQATVAAQTLGLPILIVCPQSPVGVWKNHIEMLTDKQPVIVARPLEFRWPREGEAVIGTYHQLSWLTYQARKSKKRLPNFEAKHVIMEIAKGPRMPVVVIFDEAHALKGFTGRAIQGRNISEACRFWGGHTWALTGTPLPCSPLDLWGLVSALGVEKDVFQNFENFLAHFGGKEISWKSVTQECTDLAKKYGYTYPQVMAHKDRLASTLPSREIAFHTKLDINFIQAWRALQNHLQGRKRQSGGKRYIWSPKPPGGSVLPLFKGTALRRLRAHVLSQLDPITHRVFYVPVTDIPVFAHRKAGEAVQFLEERTGLPIEQVTLKSMEIALGDATSQEHLFSALRLLAEAKIPLLSKIVEEHEEAFNPADESSCPIAVCSEYRKPIEYLMQRPKWAAIVGGCSSHKRLQTRGAMLEALQQKELFGIGFTGAGEEGLTLTTCYRLIKVSSSLSPSREAQREARVHRYGQTRGVIVDHLVVNHPLDLFALRIGAAKSTISKIALDTPSTVV